jgi:RNA polymerase sigma-70 factor (ECF subfamily)
VSPVSFKDIIDTYQKQVYNLAYQYVQQSEDAEEITQDVFLKVYDSMDAFKGQAQLKTWIYRITVNTCLDHLKSKRFKLFKLLFASSLQTESDTLQQSINFYHPQQQLENKEGLARLLQAIHQLPPQQKIVVLLLKVEQLSQQETAEIMQLSTKAIESLFQRAKKNLEKKLKHTKENE